MNFFSEDFKNNLYETIEDIENNSLVEIVGIVRQQSEKYRDVGLLFAAITTAILYTVLIIIPATINPYLIYLSTIVFYLIAYFGIMAAPSFLRLFICSKRQNKAVELMSRAVFQKGGIRHTQEKIGVLFFVSILEKKVKIIADRGAEMSVPLEEWEKIQAQFDKTFDSSDAQNNFLKSLTSTKEIFSKYIPPVEDDINELPDNLKVDL